MAQSPYATELADALDQTIAELERRAGAGATGPAASGGAFPRGRSTGAPPPSAPPPAPVPVPAPVAPPEQADGAGDREASAPSTGAFGAPGAAPPPVPELPYAPAPPAPAQAPYAPAAAPPPDVIDGNLSTQIRRLEELRRWVRDDPAFGQLVDNMIGRQVQAAEKRQRVYTAVFSIVSLAVGWLLPVLVPATYLTTLLPH